MSPMPVRFHDPRATLADFTSSMLVRCPRCEHIAYFEQRPCTPPDADGKRYPHTRLVCRSCGLCRIRIGADHSSRYSSACTCPALWLRTGTRHGELWAYNLQHLDLIRRFVAADLRERAPWYDTGRKMTLVARLPAWIKSAKNRDEVLRAVDRLRATVITPG
ncbi:MULTISPECIES: hypothetical protein [unclassified Streptomyces]|uniref:hypothetical protein n=1 Tax=unclassified Streptomyces TaxID=2593676 RepID=UPI00190AED5D|nr:MULTISPECIES: hypothetical protein [unclassified Streptomyces]MBK3565224.1 hypothetical protein [Streptomyces sp. MBT62]MBK6013651.1 hypothetical protein [Streptomyces sp. MBT53]